MRRKRRSCSRCSSVRRKRYASCERRGVVAPDVSTFCQRAERANGVAASQSRVSATVDELQELNRELDVSQTTRPKLELPVGLGLRDVRFDPSPHLLHVDDEPLAAGRVPRPRG